MKKFLFYFTFFLSLYLVGFFSFCLFISMFVIYVWFACLFFPCHEILFPVFVFFLSMFVISLACRFLYNNLAFPCVFNFFLLSTNHHTHAFNLRIIIYLIGLRELSLTFYATLQVIVSFFLPFQVFRGPLFSPL